MDNKEYVAAAVKTASPSFHADSMDPAIRDSTIYAVIAFIKILDGMKKALFYGKPFSIEKMEEQFDADIQKAKDREEGEGVLYLESIPHDVLHAAIGLVTEAGELLQAVVTAATIHEGRETPPIDRVNLKEEAGDCLWYLALLSRGAGFSLEEAMLANIKKLAKRYGAGAFDGHEAVTRDLEAERKVLEA